MSDAPIIPPGQVLPPMDGPIRHGSTPTEADATKPNGRRKRSTRDRFATLNAFADAGARLVDPTAQACWWIVYRDTKPTGLARVSHGHVANCIGVSRSTAIRAMRRLENAGLLTVVRRGGLVGGMSTYRVHPTPKADSAAA